MEPETRSMEPTIEQPERPALMPLLDHMLPKGARENTGKLAVQLWAGQATTIPALSDYLEVDERKLRRSLAWLKRHGYVRDERGARLLQWPAE